MTIFYEMMIAGHVLGKEGSTLCCTKPWLHPLFHVEFIQKLINVTVDSLSKGQNSMKEKECYLDCKKLVFTLHVGLPWKILYCK